MSWHYLQGQVEASSADLPADFAPSALSRSTSTRAESYLRGSVTDTSRGSLSGTTSAPSTGDHGEATLTSSRAGSRAKTSPAPASGQVSLALDLGCGESLPESSEKCGRRSSLLRTRITCDSPGSTPCSRILPRSGTMHNGRLLERPTLAPRIAGIDCGFSHIEIEQDMIYQGPILCTPTTKLNEWSPYMRRWPSHLALQDTLPGRCPLAIREWLMGWPIGWTALWPLAMDRWREWQDWHGPDYCDGLYNEWMNPEETT